MRKPQHLSDDILVRLLDDELSTADISPAQDHLECCAECKQRYIDLDEASRAFENFTQTISLNFDDSERDDLIVLLKAREKSSTGHVDIVQRAAWAIAI